MSKQMGLPVPIGTAATTTAGPIGSNGMGLGTGLVKDGDRAKLSVKQRVLGRQNGQSAGTGPGTGVGMSGLVGAERGGGNGRERRMSLGEGSVSSVSSMNAGASRMELEGLVLVENASAVAGFASNPIRIKLPGTVANGSGGSGRVRSYRPSPSSGSVPSRVPALPLQLPGTRDDTPTSQWYEDPDAINDSARSIVSAPFSGRRPDGVPPTDEELVQGASLDGQENKPLSLGIPLMSKQTREALKERVVV